MGRESEYIHKRHNVSVLLYHFVCPAKYRRVVFDEAVDRTIREVCEGIELRYNEIRFIEIGTDKDHVHFLIQSTPPRSPTQIIRTIKSITAKEVFVRHPEVKQMLWGGEFWSSGFYVNTVGKNANEPTIAKYVREQGREEEYKKMYGQQIKMFLE